MRNSAKPITVRIKKSAFFNLNAFHDTHYPLSCTYKHYIYFESDQSFFFILETSAYNPFGVKSTLIKFGASEHESARVRERARATASLNYVGEIASGNFSTRKKALTKKCVSVREAYTVRLGRCSLSRSYLSERKSVSV